MIPQPVATTHSNTAVFIDYENIYYYLKNTMRDIVEINPVTTEVIRNLKIHLENELSCQVILTNAYADFERMGNGSLSALYLMGIVSSNVLGASHKNAADMQMCIDIMSMLYTRPDITRFVVMAGDRDYIPVIQHLKRTGKTVMVAAFRGTLSGDLLDILGEKSFIDIQPMLNVPTATPAPTQEIAVELPVVAEAASPIVPAAVKRATAPAKDNLLAPIETDIKVLGKVNLAAIRQRKPAPKIAARIRVPLPEPPIDDLSACLVHILGYINNRINYCPGIVLVFRYLTDKMPLLANWQRKTLIEDLQSLGVINVIQMPGQENSYSAIEINYDHEMVRDILDRDV